VDLLIDWENQAVTVYVNGTQLASDKFFTNSKTTIKTANSILLYNLTPGGHCRVKKLMVCEDRCDSKSFFSLKFLIGNMTYVYAFGELLRKFNLMLLLALLSLVYLL